MESKITELFAIEDLEMRIQQVPAQEAERLERLLKARLGALPRPLREQYEWLRTWTRYPIARLRAGACTGCGTTYPPEHAFLQARHTQVTYCEHCMRILLLRDLLLVA